MLLIAIFGATLLGAGLGTRTLTQHEVFAAYPAKEMLRYGHWVLPMFAGVPRVIKPPGASWLIAASMKLFHSDAEWVARLPSVTGGVLLALMVGLFAGRHLGRQMGLLSGLILLTSFYTLLQGRLCEADMMLSAAVAAAMFSFAMGVLPRAGQLPDRWRRFGWALGFYAAAGVSFLLKWPGPVFIFAAAIAYAIVAGDRRVIRFLLHPVGLAVFLTLLIAWPLAVYLKDPAALHQWWKEGSSTTMTGFQHGSDPLYSYLLSVPMMLMPWTPVVAIGFWVAIRRRAWRRPLGQFLLCWVVPGFLMLHLSAMKTKHYAIPILSPFSILGAIGLLKYIEYQHTNRRPLRGVAAGAYVAACLSATVAVRFIPITRPVASQIAVVVAVLAIGGVIAIYMEHRKHTVGQLAAIFATAWAAIVGANVLVLPHFDDYRFGAEFGRQANSAVPPGQTVYIIDPEQDVPPQIAYYLRPPIWRYQNEAAFAAFAKATTLGGSQQRLYVIVAEPMQTAVADLGRVKVLAVAEPQTPRKNRSDQLRLVELTPTSP